MRKLTEKELVRISNNELIKAHNLDIGEEDRKWFSKITGMSIAAAFEQGPAGADAFLRYAEWQDTNPHVTL